MSRFFVGQRVRIVASKTKFGAHHIGHEGYIISESHYYPNHYVISGAQLRSDGFSCVWYERHLEPITKPRHEACDEDFKRDLDKLLEKADASQHHA